MSQRLPLPDSFAPASALEPASSAALSARGIEHVFGTTRALDGVDLEAAVGGSVALVGESGSGKTTLLRCFNGIVIPSRGVVRVAGVDVASASPEQLRRRIGYVPQDGGLLPHWTVRRNVELVPRLLGMPSAREAAADAMRLAGLDASEFGDRFPTALSGGQRQRAALARAIAARPPIVLLDEPFGALDAISRAELHDAFETVRRATRVTTLLVTHDLAEAARLCERLVVMRRGRIEQQGSFDELRDAPATPYVASLVGRALATAAQLSGAPRP